MWYAFNLGDSLLLSFVSMLPTVFLKTLKKKTRIISPINQKPTKIGQGEKGLNGVLREAVTQGR